MADEDQMSEINLRIFNAVSGYRMGSEDAYQAARHEINKMFADGLFSGPPEWEGRYSVTCTLNPEVREISVRINLSFDGSE